MASNLHKIPANFEIEPRSHPFKVFIRKKSENTFECYIERNSIVYDFYNDKEVKVDGLDKVYTIQAGNRVILTLNYEQAGLIISSASIKVSNSEPAEPTSTPCFPNDEYYNPQTVKCVSKTETQIAMIEAETGSSTYELKVIQYVYHHLTKFACYIAPSQF